MTTRGALLLGENVIYHITLCNAITIACIASDTPSFCLGNTSYCFATISTARFHQQR